MITPGCPFCGEPENQVDEISPGTFAVVCQDCGTIGPHAKRAEQAVIRWNRRVNRLDWPVKWLPMPDDPRAAGITVTFGP